MKRFTAILLLAALLLCGCGEKETAPEQTTVSGMVISVDGMVSDSAPRRVQPQPVSMEMVRTSTVKSMANFFMINLLCLCYGSIIAMLTKTDSAFH